MTPSMFRLVSFKPCFQDAIHAATELYFSLKNEASIYDTNEMSQSLQNQTIANPRLQW